jgi:quercetin dioxygenase-like cupin family protein
MVREAPPEQTEHGLLPTGEDGWYVLNAREAMWRTWAGRGRWPRLEGATPVFEQLGVVLRVLEPGEPMSMYHWESDQEGFLVLAGEALAIVEGEERPLRQWDFLHCPAGTNHVVVGAGDGPCVVFAVGSRQNHTYRTPDGSIDGRDDWGAYTVDEAALRHGAGVEEETVDADVAYGRFDDPELTRYRDSWLPDLD